MRLTLASASPRRLALLHQIGIYPWRVISPEIDETPRRTETPPACAARLAMAKLSATLPIQEVRDVILAADTVVALGRRILGKPENAKQAEQYLTLLSGRRHRIYGAIAIAEPDNPKPRTRMVVSVVSLKRLSRSEISDYVTLHRNGAIKPADTLFKAEPAAFVARLSGSYSNVVGLAVHETYQLLSGTPHSRDLFLMAASHDSAGAMRSVVARLI